MTKVLSGVALVAVLFGLGCGQAESETGGVVVRAARDAALQSCIDGEDETATDAQDEAASAAGSDGTHNGNTGCGCGRICPFEIPEASCEADEKVRKVKADCIFEVICDGVVLECSVPVKIPTCVPQGASCGQE